MLAGTQDHIRNVLMKVGKGRVPLGGKIDKKIQVIPANIKGRTHMLQRNESL
jgi:hypothetical protein